MNQLENLFKVKLLEIGVRNCLACKTVIEELLLESKITYSQSNILHNWLNYGEWT